MPKSKRVTKREWYDVYGGFENPGCFRRHNGRHWLYFVQLGTKPMKKGGNER